MFDRYFINDGVELNWNYIDSIPEFQKLKECEQTPKWHKEGNAYEHVKCCLNVAYNLIRDEKWERKDIDRKRCFLMSVLFHDIGKITTTKFIRDDWHSYGHEVEGDKITRKILWNEDQTGRETVCSMVRWHMERCGLNKCRNVADKSLKIALFADMEMLYDVMFCDIFGSTPEDETSRHTDISIIDTMRLLGSNANQYNTCGIRRNLFHNEPCFVNYSIYPKITVLVGLPGSGKDTWISKNVSSDDVVICRDDIRAELGLCAHGEKIVGTREQEEIVSKIFNKKLIDAAESSKNIVINNINLKKKYRDAYRTLLNKYKYYWVYQVIEAPTLADNIQRRDGQINKEVFTNMILAFDWPTCDEYDVINIEKQ